MGLGPSKEKIRKILERSIQNPNNREQKNLKIEYKYTQEIDMEEASSTNTTTGGSDMNTGESFNFSVDENFTIISPNLDVKNVKKFPYNTVGTITVQFANFEEKMEYTCFLIDTNVVVTLASNIEKEGLGRAKVITTTFSEEKVKSENVYIQGEQNTKDKGKKNEQKSIDNTKSKLACILYDENISSEWSGAEGGEQKDFEGRDTNVIWSLGNKKKEEETESEDTPKEKEKGKVLKVEPHLREINVNNSNPFRNLADDNEKECAKRVLGSPIYYKDFNNGAYVIGIVAEGNEFQYFDVNAMIFLCDMTNKGKLLRKKIHKGIDEDNIVKLDLSRNDFGPLDIKYLTDFDLKNLRILDLSSNSIKPQGAFYLSQGKFNCLESLNLNFNEIGDEGLNHIATGFFSKLNYLYLFHNNISVEGIKNLVKAEFISNLVILSLSENPNIGDSGVRIMKEHKGWQKLNTLNLNSTGLTDEALRYLGEASMPQLKKLNILGNKFTEGGKASINGLRMNHIHVTYRTQAERDAEKRKKEKEANKK